jgi:hypothetical protein
VRDLYLSKIEDGTHLRCARCGGEYLHHVKVEVFEGREDAAKGVHLSIDGGCVKVDDDLAGNPSSRRHGLTIHLTCEFCAATNVLTIAQHKGLTLLEVANGCA